MPGDCFDPTPEENVVVLVDASILCKAEPLIKSCEHCNRNGAEIPFDNILDQRCFPPNSLVHLQAWLIEVDGIIRDYTADDFGYGMIIDTAD